ncbi:MAG: hypothetical protein ACUVSV_15310 [Armatimonadota bacterium]
MLDAHGNIFLQKQHLKSAAKFYAAVRPRMTEIHPLLGNYSSAISEHDLSNLLLSACRANEFDVFQHQGTRHFTNVPSLRKWLTSRLLPCAVSMRLDDPDALRLLVFSIEITEQMFLGGIRRPSAQRDFGSDRDATRRYLWSISSGGQEKCF